MQTGLSYLEIPSLTLLRHMKQADKKGMLVSACCACRPDQHRPNLGSPRYGLVDVYRGLAWAGVGINASRSHRRRLKWGSVWLSARGTAVDWLQGQADGAKEWMGSPPPRHDTTRFDASSTKRSRLVGDGVLCVCVCVCVSHNRQARRHGACHCLSLSL